jgi:phosphate transport system substrate-binding protein
MKKINYIIGLLVFSVVVALNSCNSSGTDENATHGKIKIGVDESYQLLLDTEIYTFESTYRKADITPFYKPELEVLDDFMKDSIRLMVTSRLLTKDEEEFLKSKQIVARNTKIAYDALAFIVNKNRVDTMLKYPIIKDIFSGTLNNWKQINSKNVSSELMIVFDNQKSGNVRYFVEKFKLSDKLPENIFAADNNNEVINYVEKHKDAIGVISVNWISDKHDSISNAFLSRINVVAVTNDLDPDGDYYKPYQAYIADKSYPFVRDVYMISRESFTGLGSGFIRFVSGDIGQRIILKSKLVPAQAPIRLIDASRQSIEVK